MLLKTKTLKLTAIFFIPLIIGFTYGKFFLHTSAIVSNEIDYGEILFKILTKNLTCVIVLIISTFFGALLIKTFLGINGLMTGLIISKFQSIKYLALILPHGIIEIPAFLFLAYVLLKAIDRNRFDLQAIKGISIATSLVIIGAFIETYITPNIANFIFF